MTGSLLPPHKITLDDEIKAATRELRDLNATLRCHRVARMADAAVRIDRRLAKKLPLR